MRLDHFNGTEAQTEKRQVLTFSHISDINDLLWRQVCEPIRLYEGAGP